MLSVCFVLILVVYFFSRYFFLIAAFLHTFVEIPVCQCIIKICNKSLGNCDGATKSGEQYWCLLL